MGPIGNYFIAMIKDSALVSLIGVQEVLWRAETAGRPTLHTLEAFIIAALVYWGLTIIFSFFQTRLERRMARGDRSARKLARSSRAPLPRWKRATGSMGSPCWLRVRRR